MEFLNVFASVDKDQDLVIHEADLDSYAAEMKYEKVFTQKWLRLFDRNKDGKFTFGEFCETLGLDEKIYEEKLREARKNIALKQQQPQQSADADRANRRTSRLPKQQVSTFPANQYDTKDSKENIEPQQAKRSQNPVKVDDDSRQSDIQEDVVQQQTSKRVHSGYPNNNSKTSPDEVAIELDEYDLLRSVDVEFADMDPRELDEVKAIYAKLVSSNNDEAANEFDRQLMCDLDKKLGKTWQCQSNPELSHKEVNYKEGGMAVLAVAKQQKRVMIWRPAQAGGMCCCC